MKRKSEKIHWYQKTGIVILFSILGSFLGFASIASFLGIRLDDTFREDDSDSKEVEEEC